MATSGSVNFAITRNDILKHALLKIGAIAADETPTNAEYADAAITLNMMLKAWGSSFYLWGQQQATLFLQSNTHQYALGPSGAHGTHSYTRTTISADEASGQTVLSVTSETGMSASDYINIVLDDGTSHWTTIASVGTLTVDDALPSAASSGNSVYFYTTKMHRPLRLIKAYLSDLSTSNQDLPVDIIDRDRYFEIYDKTQDSTPNMVYYDPQLTNGQLYTNYEQTNMNEHLKLIYQRPLEDFDASTDNPDVPQEYYEQLVYGLAIRLAPEYGLESGRRRQLLQEAQLLGIGVMGFYQDSPRRVSPTYF